MPSRQVRIPAQERLFSLVLALLASDAGLNKAEILSTVQGYRQRFSVGGENQSLERQFERDKDDLRELGIPIETLEPPGEPGNNQLLRYRIPRGAYELPSDLSFSPEELGILSLAGTAWREGALSAQSQRALLKLRSLGVTTAQNPESSYAPRISTVEDCFAPLSSALDRHRLVEFQYLKPGQFEAKLRRVAPLALVQHRGRWHLYAHDVAADRPRTYLLSRIVGSVREQNATHELDLSGAAEHALRALDELWDAQSASIRVVQHTDAALRLAARASAINGDVLTVNFTDRELLADELAGYGPDVFVIEPQDLVDAVCTRLDQVLAHQIGADPAPPASQSTDTEGV